VYFLFLGKIISKNIYDLWFFFFRRYF
jgi:hypothetical protein